MATAPPPIEPARSGPGAAVESMASGRRSGWPVAVVAGVPVLGLGFAEGGYFATAWGWAALAFLWCGAVTLVLKRKLRIGVLDAVFVGDLAALLMWTLASTIWSASPSESVLEVQRGLVYLAAAATLVVVVERRSVGWLLGGLLGAIGLTCGYGLMTRLFPRTFGVSEPLGAYRLAEPIGYWNALGVLAAMGAVLAFGLAVPASRRGRALLGAVLVVLLPALYFTFGRAAWVALGFGLAATFLIARGRRRALGSAIMLIAPWCGVAVALAAGAPALTTSGAPVDEIADAGRRLAVGIAFLAGAAALATLAQPRLEAALSALPLRRVRPAIAGAVIAAALGAALVGCVVAAGGPERLLGSLGNRFSTPPAPTGGHLDQRLFSLYGEGRAAVWRVAADGAWTHPVAGIGAGAFEQHWLANRPQPQNFRDAHNLYLETFVELGIVGLALLVTMLAVPVVAAVRAREDPLVPAAAGGLVCYLVHAAFDWDWEMPAVTVAALACAAATLALARPDAARALSWQARAMALAAVVALAAVAIVGLVGNGAVGASIAALRSGDYQRAEREAGRATRWSPWSAEPWRWLGEARLARGDAVGARRSFAHALRRAPRDWALWYGIALTTEGAARRRAIARATALNPLSPDVRSLTDGSALRGNSHRLGCTRGCEWVSYGAHHDAAWRRP
jgi:hypothetical protein